MNPEDVANAIARETSQVDTPVGFLTGTYKWEEFDHLPANMEYAQDVAKVALMALARHFDFVNVQQMLDVLEINRGKR